MLSTREYLEQPGHKNLLDLVGVVRLSVASDLAAKQRAEDAIDELVECLQEENIAFEYDQTNKVNRDLLTLLTQAAHNQVSNVEYNRRLVAWAISYKEYDKARQAELQNLSRQAISDNEGLIRALLNDEATSKRLGDHEDACFILRKHIVRQSNQIKADQNNVLGTVAADSFDNLVSVVLDAIKGNEDKNFSVHIPLCVSRGHWIDLNLDVKKGKITDAELWDPKGDDADVLRSSPAYANVQAVVDVVNGKEEVIVAAVKADVQPDGDAHSCLDLTLQHILQKVDDNGFVANAESEELRHAIIVDIVENHPAVSKHVDAMFSAEASQIKLDELLAQQLQNSFDQSKALFDQLTDAEAKAKEAQLFALAKTHAVLSYAGLINKFGVMAKSCSREVATPISDATIAPVIVKA